LANFAVTSLASGKWRSLPRGHELVSILAAPPSLFDPPAGCRFGQRCPSPPRAAPRRRRR
jgi:ABC-type dipeptide/oligopeptide/nickel transport system ATPase component